MSEEIKDMIEPIPNWEFTYRYDGSRTCGKSYIQSLLDEKDKQIEDLQQKVEQLENIRKEAIKYVRKNQSAYVELLGNTISIQELFTTNINLLNILNKGDNNVKNKR